MTRARTSQGHTLPELLVGMALGLVIIAAALLTWQSSRQSWLSLRTADAVHSQAQAALRTVVQHARLAGAMTLQSTGASTWEIINPYLNSLPDVTGTHGSQAQRSLSLAHSSAVENHDCQGNYRQKQSVVRNDFRFNSSNDFSCKDLNESGSTYQALAEGVEDLQVRYAQANPTLSTLQWKLAHEVSDMRQVVALEVCLLIASQTGLSYPPPPTPLLDCLGEPLPHKAQWRRVYRRMVMLRHHQAVMP